MKPAWCQVREACARCPAVTPFLELLQIFLSHCAKDLGILGSYEHKGQHWLKGD